MPPNRTNRPRNRHHTQHRPTYLQTRYLTTRHRLLVTQRRDLQKQRTTTAIGSATHLLTTDLGIRHTTHATRPANNRRNRHHITRTQL
jgi:hypothetical protein